MCFVKKLVLPFGFLKAQYYPVQGTLQVKRSYSLYLNDYALPSREALVVSLTNRDIQTPRYKSAPLAHQEQRLLGANTRRALL